MNNTKKIIKKIAKVFFIVIAIIGLFAAVCVTDGCEHEIEIRAIGACVFFGGLVFASLMGERDEEW